MLELPRVKRKDISLENADVIEFIEPSKSESFSVHLGLSPNKATGHRIRMQGHEFEIAGKDWAILLRLYLSKNKAVPTEEIIRSAVPSWKKDYEEKKKAVDDRFKVYFSHLNLLFKKMVYPYYKIVFLRGYGWGLFWLPDERMILCHEKY